MCHMSHATRVLPLAGYHAVAHTGTMTYQHMNQTEPCNQGQATRYRVQYPDDEGWTRTTTVDFPTLVGLLGSTADALRIIFRGPGSMMWDLKLLACDTYGDQWPLIGLTPDGGRTTTVDFPTLCDNGCGSATDDPEGQAWHDETCPSCHAMILDAGGMIHRMGY